MLIVECRQRITYLVFTPPGLVIEIRHVDTIPRPCQVGAGLSSRKQDVHDIGAIFNVFRNGARAVERGAAGHGIRHVDVADGTLHAVQGCPDRRLHDRAVGLAADAEGRESSCRAYCGSRW